MTEELCKIIGIIIIIGFLLFLAVKSLKLQLSMVEGFVGSSQQNAIATGSSGENGVAGNANQYAGDIKTQVIKMQDTMLIAKYRKDYENTIINLDDYVNYMMLQTILNINTDSSASPVQNLQMLDRLNTLNESKISLNAVMKFVDNTK
jgi:hypothetical protein